MWQEILKYTKEFYPPVFWAILVLFVGYFVSKWIGSIVSRALNRLKINQLLRGMGLQEAIERAGVKFDAEKFIGLLVKWYFIFLFLMWAFEILNFPLIANYLGKIVSYYPNIFVACLLFLIALFLSNFSRKIVVGTFEKERITYSGFLGRWLSFAIWTITILAIFYQLKIVPEIILTVLIGFVIAFALTLGLSFGLGGKDLVSKFLKEFEEKFKR
jgi:hypothetical protein